MKKRTTWNEVVPSLRLHPSTPRHLIRQSRRAQEHVRPHTPPRATRSRPSRIHQIPSTPPSAGLMASLRVLSIAVIGKHGNPLFLQSYSTRKGAEADLKWHYAAHTALDFFDERGESPALSLVSWADKS